MVSLKTSRTDCFLGIQTDVNRLFQTKENNSLKSVNNDLNEVRSKLDVLKGADVELKRRLVELNELEKRLQLTASQLEQERCEKVSGRHKENK